MKKSILTIVFVALSALVVFQGCKKPRCPEPDPCSTPATVMAVDADFYSSGHFKAENSDVYLFAVNFDAYASRITPGRMYKIGYEEVPCEEMVLCGDQGIAKGGCVQYPRQCIRILCLEAIKCEQNSCFSAWIGPEDYERVNSQAMSSNGISGNSLDATVSFSGCSAQDPVKFMLYAQYQNKQENGLDVWEVKAVNVSDGITCQAVFSKSVCFDLSGIKKSYMAPNQLPPAEVMLKLQTWNGLQEFVYKF